MRQRRRKGIKALPHRNDLMKPTVDAIKALGGSGSVDEISDKVITILGIPDELASRPHVTKYNRQDGRTQLEYELAWVRTSLKQLGVLENSTRGIWAVTGKQFIGFSAEEVVFADRVDSEAHAIESLVEWRERVNTYLVETLSPNAFERLIQRMLRETGFTQVEVSGRTGDGGIDGQGIAKVNGILSFRVVFQCKRYRGAVGPSEVRDFRGAMQGRADKGLLITTGYFTREATREAIRDGAIAIDLIDGEKLAEKLKELGLGIKIERVETVLIDEEWFKSI